MSNFPFRWKHLRIEEAIVQVPSVDLRWDDKHLQGCKAFWQVGSATVPPHPWEHALLAVLGGGVEDEKEGSRDLEVTS